MVGRMPRLNGAFGLFDHRFDAGGLRKHFPGLGKDVQADGSGGYGLATTVEDAGVQFVFEFLYHGAQRGLCHAAVLGRFGKVAVLLYGEDVF